MKNILSRKELIKYMIENKCCVTKEFAEQLIDNGVENITWMNVKYLGFDKFEINKLIY